MRDSSLSKPLTKPNLFNYRAANSLSRKNLIINESSKPNPESTPDDVARAKAEENDLQDAILNFFVNSLGTGCLSLPIILKYSGLLVGSSILILTSYLSYLSMNSVSVTASRINLFDYSKLVKRLLGKVRYKQNAILFLDIIFMLYYFFLVMGYLLVSIQSIVSAFKYFDINLVDDKLWLMIGFCFIIVFPLSLFKSILDHKFFIYFTMFSIIYICLSIILEMPDYVEENSLQDLKLYEIDWHLFTSFNFALFSYACQRRVTSVFAKMNNHSVTRMKKVNFRVCFYQMLFFIIVANIGYLSLLDNTPLFIINRDPPKSSTESFNMFVARVLVAIIMLYTMPGNVISVRESVKNLMIRQKRQTFSMFW